jgi:hypothetical protein
MYKSYDSTHPLRWSAAEKSSNRRQFQITMGMLFDDEKKALHDSLFEGGMARKKPKISSLGGSKGGKSKEQLMQHYKNTNFLVFPHTTNVIFCPTPKAPLCIGCAHRPREGGTV